MCCRSSSRVESHFYPYFWWEAREQSGEADPVCTATAALSGSSLFSHLKSQKAFKLQEKSIFGGLEHPVTVL